MKLKLQIIIVFITISSYSQQSIPTYKEVVSKLFTEYKADSINQIKYIQFEKRDIGWKISTIDPHLKDTVNELFWENKKKKYNKINFPSKLKFEDDEDAIDNFMNSTSPQRFNSLKYYGYVGWNEDLINFYKNKKTLTDLELYSLGYAYSNYANGLLNDNFEFSNDKVKFNLPIALNSMTNEQLENYLAWENKAIDAYLELYQRNPKFETIPGGIGIKYYNEIASNFLNLRIYKNEQIAMAQLHGKKMYSENYNEYNKNMLDSCEKDAILFTMGDNDTFPLLVYQAQNKYRTDVLIVNTSLLQAPHYIIMMKNRVLDSDGIKLSISSELIKDELNEVFIFKNDEKKAIPIDKLNEVISNKSNKYEGYSRSYKAMPSNKFSFNESTSFLNWTIDEQAMYRSELISLDIIATNKWKRPIYFATNGSNRIYLGLSKYLQFEGLVYKLTSNEGKVSEDEIGFVNPDILEQHMNDMFQFKNKTNLPVEERQLVMDYRFIYKRLADYYIKEGDHKKAELILDECVKIYPNNLSYFSFDMLYIIKGYYEINSLKKAKGLEKVLLQNLENGFDNYSFLSKEDREIKYELLKMSLQFAKETKEEE